MEKEIYKVKITKAVMKTFWYAKRIGEIFEVTESKTIGSPKDWYYAERYKLILDGETLYSFIRVEDCKIVND